jgi:hypothetical protein
MKNKMRVVFLYTECMGNYEARILAGQWSDLHRKPRQKVDPNGA